MNGGNSNCENMINTIDQNASPDNDNHNTSEFGGIEEPYAMDVLRKNCKLCIGSKASKEFKTYTCLRQHFMDKHLNVPIEYEVVKSKRRVRCSGCLVELNAKNFGKHKLKVHARPLTGSIRPNESLNDQKPSLPEEIEEAYAIDIPTYACGLCKIGPMRKKLLNIHFEVKHNNATPDVIVMKCDKRVKCSSCKAKMFTKNFPKHKRKVHNQIDINCRNETLTATHHNANNEIEGIEEPFPIDMLVKICSECKAEYVTERRLKKHFEYKHADVPMQFVVQRSDKICRCSACKSEIKMKNFVRHTEKCPRVKSQKASQMKNHRLCKESVTESVIETQKSDKHIVKECQPSITHTLEPRPYRTFKSDKYVVKETDPTINAHTMAPRLFRCKKCGANNILEQNIMKHHLDNHRSKSSRKCLLNALSNEFYHQDSKEMLTDETKIQCEFCKLEFDENSFERHLRTVHSKSVVINDNEPIIDHSEVKSNKRIQFSTSQQLTAIKIYKCLACDARDIMEPNLVTHHLKKHVRIPIEVNIFEMTAQIRREKCNICQRCLPEGRLKEHKKRSHYHKIRSVVYDPTVDLPRETNFSNKIVVQNATPARTELHKCLKCRAVVEKDNLHVHRKNHKKKISMMENLFELIGTKDVIKCVACLQFIEPEQFNEHMKKHSTFVFVSADGKPLLNPKQDIRRSFQQKSVFIQPNTKFLPKYRYIYKCRACEIIKRKKVYIGDTGLDGWAIQKHVKTHQRQSRGFGGNIFRLFKVKVKCNVCDRYMKEDIIEKHMKKEHKWNYDMNFVQLYKCGVCDAHGMSKRNLEAHHSRSHKFSIESNNFKVCAIKQKVECDCCGKRYMEGRQKKHKLRVCVQRAIAIEMVRDEEKAIEVFEDDQLACDEECNNDAKGTTNAVK